MSDSDNDNLQNPHFSFPNQFLNEKHNIPGALGLVIFYIKGKNNQDLPRMNNFTPHVSQLCLFTCGTGCLVRFVIFGRFVIYGENGGFLNTLICFC